MLKQFFNSLSRKDSWLVRWLNGDDDDDSVGFSSKISRNDVIGLPPVWYAINKVSGHLGLMPLAPRKRNRRGGSEPARRHPAYRLTKKRPNRNTNAFSFWETMIANALLTGRSVAAVIREDGKPKELIPFLMSRTVVMMVGGEKWFGTYVEKDEPLEEYLDESESDKPSRRYYFVPDRDVIDVPGLSLNGVDCISLIKVANEAFSNSKNGQTTTNKNFRNPRPGLMLEAPVGMFRDDEDAQDFIDQFNESHSGLDEQGKAGLLRDGMKVITSPVNGTDAQWIEQRKFERQEIALLFMLEQILGDDESVSYNSMEQKNIAYLTNCLLKWIVKIEQECDEKLLSERQKIFDTHYFKMNASALLRADSKTQMETLTGYIAARVMNPNEARDLLDMNPYDGGDEFENPAITPGKPGSSNEGEKETDQESQAKAAIVSRLNHLAGVEAKRVIAAAENRGLIFSKFLDSFYRDWPVTLSRAVEDMGGDPDLAKQYCDRSYAELFDLEGTMTDLEQWPVAVADLVNGWPKRTEALADSIIQNKKGDKLCVENTF